MCAISLHDEIDTYNAEEADEHTMLFDTLNKVADRLAVYSGEIENLEDWVVNGDTRSLAKSSITATVFTAKDFNLLNNHSFMEARDILADGYFCNTVIMDENGDIHSYEFNKNDKFYRFLPSQRMMLHYSLKITKKVIQSFWKV
ncbi:MAG: hypothetical protein ACLR6B_03825 [Blautia sp.]